MKRKLVFLMICWGIALHAFSYHAPLGTKIGTFANTFDLAYVLQPSSLQTIPQGSDCFTFVLQMNMSSRDFGSIFSIHNKNTDVTLLSVDFNSLGKVVVSRPFGNGTVSYEIYDRLLHTPTTGTTRHEFRIFLCGSFIWLEVTAGSEVSVSPIFWGINRPDVNMVEQIVQKNGAYEFIFGSLSNTGSTLVHGNLEVYASKYQDLKNDIIQHFIPTEAVQTRSAEASATPNAIEMDDDIRVYPTYVDQELHVDLELGQAGEVVYEVYGLQGALWFQTTRSYTAEGSYKEMFARSRMTQAKGMAVLVIRTPEKTVTKKIFFR